MKRTVAWITVLILLTVGLCGCKSNEKSGSTAAAGTFVEGEEQQAADSIVLNDGSDSSEEKQPSDGAQQNETPQEKPQQTPSDEKEDEPDIQTPEEAPVPDGGNEESDQAGESGGLEEITEANLKIMSYNIRYTDDPNGHSIADRAPRVDTVIKNHAPDLVAMQEVVPAWTAHFEEKWKDSNYAFTYRYRSNKNPEGLAFLYNTDTLEMIKEDFFWLSDTPNKESKSYDSSLPRICHWAEFKHKATGSRFMYYNLHLGGTEEANIGSYNQVMREFEKNKKIACFTGGDLNMTPGASYNLFSDILDEARALVGKTPEVNWASFGAGYPDAPRVPNGHGNPIDIIYHQEEFAEAVSYQIDRPYFDGKAASDHYPVITTYILK